jgi:Protein of unknown function (DUF1569)
MTTTSATAAPIDTGKVTGRRQLHFADLAAILADVELLASSREIRTLGNMSAGQIVEHLARSMTKSIDGYQNGLPAPVRFIFRLLFKNKFLHQPMSAGFKLPKGAQAELIPGPFELGKALRNIRQAIKRLRTEPNRAPSPVIGPLTRDEWNEVHCRHAELHLSFLVPVE